MSEISRWLRAFSTPIQHASALRRIVRTFRNWAPLLLHYAWRRRGAGPITAVFRRDGTTLLLEGRADESNLWAIFGREEYPVFTCDQKIIDIGANVGLFSIFAAKRAPGAIVTAFEPVTATFDALARNVRSSGVETQVAPIKAGVSADDGYRAIYLGTSSDLASFYPDSPAQDMEWTETRCINSLLRNHEGRISLLKMDCEGAEWEILECADPSLLERVERLCVEYHAISPERMRIAGEQLTRLGFRLGQIHHHGSAHTAVIWAGRIDRAASQKFNPLPVGDSPGGPSAVCPLSRGQATGPEHRPVEIGFIAVNYKSPGSTARLISDLLAQHSSNYALTLVVADTSPIESDLAAVRLAYRGDARVRFEHLPQNPGYLGAAQLVSTHMWKQPVPDWTVVSNSDVRLPTKDVLSKIADLPADYGVVAPRIVSGQTGLDQNPFYRRRPPRFGIWLNRIIPRVRFLFWLLQTQCTIKHSIRRLARHWVPALHPSQAQGGEPIYAPHGAFMIFSREYFERGGNLQAGTFLYAEEIFVAESCRRLGLKAMYCPEIEVLHDEHVSTGSSPAVRHFMAEAADYCYREFFAKTGQ